MSAEPCEICPGLHAEIDKQQRQRFEALAALAAAEEKVAALEQRKLVAAERREAALEAQVKVAREALTDILQTAEWTEGCNNIATTARIALAALPPETGEPSTLTP